MPYSKYFKMKNCTVPSDIRKLIDDKNRITGTEFESKNEILKDKALQTEVGYTQMPNGDWLVSMVCPMPEVSREMVDWWFWWHPQEDVRYKLWFPGEHYKVSYAKKDKPYFSQDRVPEFKANTQYPVERIGKMVMPLSIEFVSPEAFGFSKEAMEENKVATIVCGHVGAMYGLVKHTEMSHIFFEDDEGGLFMISRFWIGKRLKNPLLRKMILTDETAKGMAEHCCMEYRNFAERIPVLYKEING